MKKIFCKYINPWCEYSATKRKSDTMSALTGKYPKRRNRCKEPKNKGRGISGGVRNGCLFAAGFVFFLTARGECKGAYLRRGASAKARVCPRVHGVATTHSRALRRVSKGEGSFWALWISAAGTPKLKEYCTTD